jgi:N-acetylglucosaminyldiphosphoundecaprenol N-acetyl-beta-D-mannosaminyltransferase
LRTRAKVLGVSVDPVTPQELNTAIGRLVDARAHALVLNVNAHCLNLAQEIPWLLEMLNDADLVFCDGVGVQFAARILGEGSLQRITYADYLWQFAAVAEARGYSFFFLGAKPGVAQSAADNLRARYPRLQIVGTHHGYFEKRVGSEENDAVIAAINAVKPNILMVGFGMPLQERWLLENWDSIQADVALTGGGVFDYISGRLMRSPMWMTEHGLEWLGRLIIEPRRLWRRYLIGLPVFVVRVLKAWVRLRVIGDRPSAADTDCL